MKIYVMFPLIVFISLLLSKNIPAQENLSPYKIKTLGISHELQGDLESAANYYKLAAAWGNARAQLLLANAYMHGRGVSQSTLMAHTWYMVASIMCDENLSEEYALRNRITSSEIELSIDLGVMIQQLIESRKEHQDCSEYLP